MITDVKMPKLDGMDLLKQARELYPLLPVLVITGYGTIPGAVEAMKNGATDYVVKPFSIEVLEKAVQDCLTAAPVTASVANQHGENVRIITRNPRMQKLLQIACKVAKADATVMIQGESGTGKELVALLIHAESPRAAGPFVAVNCAALPEHLLESELFGHEKGAFTGAAVRKQGKFELAGGGTILLDEVGEMALPLQSKLLRVLQERKVDRVGGGLPIPVDIRVIATTNADLRARVEKGAFREDLYYRLAVIPLELPPLRDRPEDVEVLTDHFLEQFGATGGITGAAKQKLLNHPWKGNVRELRNVVERAALLAGDQAIDVDHLALDGKIGDTGPREAADGDSSRNLRDIERRTIIATLAEHGGNRTRTAEVLGISIRTLRNKLKEYALEGHEAPKGGAGAAD
jgi:two-component system response regulator FlrC